MNEIEMNKKYRTRDGRPARVICVDAKGAQPVIALVPHGDGESIIRTSLAAKFYPNKECELDLIEVTPYDDFKIDEPVMVRCHEDAANLWVKRYFAGVMSGQPSTWDFGATSWSADNGNRSRWDECRRPTPEELK
jgi:hypothetical protein